MRGWAPRPHLLVEKLHLGLQGLPADARARGVVVGEIRRVEVVPLRLSRVTICAQEVGIVAVVVSRPFVEMIRNVECRRVGRRVFKINNNYLRKAADQLHLSGWDKNGNELPVDAQGHLV